MRLRDCGLRRVWNGPDLHVRRRKHGDQHKPGKQSGLHRGIQRHPRMHLAHERLLQLHELDAGPLQHDGNGRVARLPELCGGHEQPRLHHRTVEDPRLSQVRSASQSFEAIEQWRGNLGSLRLQPAGLPRCRRPGRRRGKLGAPYARHGDADGGLVSKAVRSPREAGLHQWGASRPRWSVSTCGGQSAA